MAERLHRAQILLEPKQHQMLTEIAHQEGRSLSDVVREIVAQYLRQRAAYDERQQALAALAGLNNLRAQILQTHGIYHGDLIAEVRAEREEQMERILKKGSER